MYRRKEDLKVNTYYKCSKNGNILRIDSISESGRIYYTWMKANPSVVDKSFSTARLPTEWILYKGYNTPLWKVLND